MRWTLGSRSAGVALGLVLAVTLAGCGGSDDDLTEPGGGPGGEPVGVGVAVDDGLTGSVTLTGFLLDDGQVRLCDAIMESYPPQCGGASVSVEGVDVAALEGATVEGEVAWLEQATVTGQLEDGVLRDAEVTG
jgi:hypothetical protein